MWLTWTVHWLQPKLLLLNVETEHVLLVVVGMTGCLPQVKVIDVGGHHLLILEVPVHLPDELHADKMVRRVFAGYHDNMQGKACLPRVVSLLEDQVRNEDSDARTADAVCLQSFTKAHPALLSPCIQNHLPWLLHCESRHELAVLYIYNDAMMTVLKQ